MNSLTFLVVFMTLSLLSLSHFTEAFSCPARLEYGNVARFPTCGEDSSGYDVGGTVTHVHQAIDAKKVAGKNDWYCTGDKSPYCCLDQASAGIGYYCTPEQ